MKKISVIKFINLCFIICVIFVVSFFTYYLIEPFTYFKGTPIENDNEIVLLHNIIFKYANFYMIENYDSVNSVIHPMIKKEKTKYIEVSNILKEKFKNIIIYNISTVRRDVYKIEYSFDVNSRYEKTDNSTIIVKINKQKNEFMVMYDSLLDK